MRRLLSIIIIAGLASNMMPVTTCIGSPLAEAEWSKAFGQAVLDWVVEPDTESINIEVDWSSASWGIGVELLLNEPINLKEVAEIEAQVHTNYGSSTKVYLMVATADDANLAFPAPLAYQVTSVPEKFIFQVDEMVRYKPDVDSKNFRKEDWQRVDRIKFILTKPKNSTENLELITISKPQFVYHGAINDKTPSEDSVIESTVAVNPPKDTLSADIEKPLPPFEESVSSEVAKQPEISDVQLAETSKTLSEDSGISPAEEPSENITSVEFNDQSSQPDESVDLEIAEQPETIDFQSLEKLADEHSPEVEIADKAVSGDEVFIQKLFFDQIDNDENCIRDWRAINDESKFFFAVNWKKRKSEFTISFRPKTPVASSGEWYLIFTARVINQSKPRTRIVAYSEDEQGLSKTVSQNGPMIKDKWKTFYIPLAQKSRGGWLSSKKADKMIDKIEITCLNSNPGLIKDDVIILKDVWLIRK